MKLFINLLLSFNHSTSPAIFFHHTYEACCTIREPLVRQRMHSLRDQWLLCCCCYYYSHTITKVRSLELRSWQWTWRYWPALTSGSSSQPFWHGAKEYARIHLVSVWLQKAFCQLCHDTIHLFSCLGKEKVFELRTKEWVSIQI